MVLSSYSVESTPTDDVFTASRKYFDERQVLVSMKVAGRWLSAKKKWEEEGETWSKFCGRSITGQIGLSRDTSPQPKSGLAG